ncbi:MAG: peptide deformylase [Nitrospirae bacterium]|nr:peptide deformylase [Nitrospirota bacterium]
MAILKVARMGHPVLRRLSEPVPMEAISGPEIQTLIDDMVETMREYDGAGLAAPQVHRPLQIVVIEVRRNPRYPSAPDIPLHVFINPTVTPDGGDMEEDFEGCLSLPDLRGRVPRHSKVRVRSFNRAGERQDFEAEGFLARAVQHECDHLQGILFVDRMRDMTTLTYLREYARHVEPNAGRIVPE